MQPTSTNIKPASAASAQGLEEEEEDLNIATQLTLFQTFRIVCIIGTHNI